MEKTTTELTNDYIKNHPHIKNCLKKKLINYSALSRLIAKELNVEKKAKKEAILIAARRFHEKLKKELTSEKKIQNLLSSSEIEIKNKIVVFILSKKINLDYVDDLHKEIRKENGTFYILEGSDNYTIITQEKYSRLTEDKLRSKIIKKNKDLALLNFKSPKEIETVPGAIAYLTAFFAENEVNIVEFLSCWTDTLFIINSKDINKAINFLKF